MADTRKMERERAQPIDERDDEVVEIDADEFVQAQRDPRVHELARRADRAAESIKQPAQRSS